jgi:hypothetical protein
VEDKVLIFWSQKLVSGKFFQILHMYNYRQRICFLVIPIQNKIFLAINIWDSATHTLYKYVRHLLVFTGGSPEVEVQNRVCMNKSLYVLWIVNIHNFLKLLLGVHNKGKTKLFICTLHRKYSKIIIPWIVKCR